MAVETTLITPNRGWRSINLSELWRYRELFSVFAWRDYKVRYKQTVIGILWAILQPFSLMLVFVFFFGRVAGLSSGSAPYPIFVYSGLLFWNYFSNALTVSSNSLVDNEGMIKKIYFPRLLLPLTSTVTPLVDFFFSLLVLGGIMAWYGFAPSWPTLALLPLLLLMIFFAASGLGTFFAAVNVRFRDVRQALPFVIQLGFFLTPVIYPLSFVPAHYQFFLQFHPVATIIQAGRVILLREGSLDFRSLAISAGLIIGWFFFALLFFRRTEKVFADVA